MLEDTGDVVFFICHSGSPVQSPGGSFLLFLIAYTGGILFHFCLSAGSCAPGSVLYASRFLCPPPVSYFRLSGGIVIYFPLSCSFFELPVQCALCLCLSLSSSPALLFQNLTQLMNTVLDTQVCVCIYIFLYINLCVCFCPLLGPSVLCVSP